jgi:ElaB/YqjD/DUF883 family membrane-anchored ribosome-binding protein
MNKRTANAATAEAVQPENIADSLQAFIEQGAETLSTLKAKVSGIIDVTQQGSRLVDRTTRLVEQRPLTSVAVAFGIGYVAMRIQTSPLTPLAMVGGLLYLVLRQSPSQSPTK